jgi:fengycin family lipopeptide synthetase B
VEHHFVHDGWSFAVLLRELKAIYPAFLAGEPSPLPELAIQYADFAVWQRQWVEGQAMGHLLDYWRQRLAGSPGVLELPADRPRPARQTFKGELELTLLPLRLYQDLREFCRREGFTLYMAMTAGFLTLLHRYTGQEDVLLGTSNANRRAREIEGMIGMVVNSLVLRGDLSGDPTFRELLERVRQVSLEAYAHQDMPFERLVQALRPDRQLGRNPLFQVMFNFHDAGVPDLDFGGMRVRFLVRGNASAKMDLNVIVIPRAEQRVGQRGAGEAEERALLHWEYSTELFDAETMRRMIGHYVNLLEAAVADPGRKLWDLPMLGEEERRRLTEPRSRSRAFDAGDCLHRVFAEQARRRPEAVALTFGGRRIPYGELDGRADRLAHRLRGKVSPGELVGLCLDRSPEMVVAILGVLKAGGAYVPLDPGYPAERLGFILDDARLRVVLTAGAAAAALPAGHGAELLRLDGEGGDLDAGAPAGPPEVAITPDFPAYVIYTSGSTGRPKGVVVSHRHVGRLFAATDSGFGFGPNDVWTLFHSYAFDFSVWELWGALLFGGRLVIVPWEVSRSPAELHALLAGEGVTVLNQTPSAFRQLVAVEEERGREGLPPGLGDLRSVIFGGEALDLASLAPWFERYGDRRPTLVNMYGITETTVHVTHRPLSARDLEASHRSPIGEPIPDLELFVLDPRGNPAPLGVPGEIHVGGAGLASGYLHRPGLTASRFVPNPFAGEGARLYRSGDLARLRPGGDLEYLGRVDDQVKIRGFRIELGEIEAALARHPAVRQSAVLAADDPSAPGESRLVAWVVPRPEAVAEGEEADLRVDLRGFLKKVVPEYMVPSAFVLLEALPMTPNGKLDRRALPQPDVHRVPEAVWVAPRTPAERALAEIWAEVLGVERVGALDDFFGLGGHSLSAARVISRVPAALGVELPLVAVFEHSTLEAMAAFAEALPRLDGDLAEAPPRDEAAGASGELLERAAGLSDDQLDALLGEMLVGREAAP